MTASDHHGHALSGASRAAAERYQNALAAYHRLAGDPMGELKAAVADSPGFTMAHALMAYMCVLGSDEPTRAMGARSYAKANTLAADAREQAHLAALRHILAGEYRAAGRTLEDLSLDHPRDVLALQVGQTMDFMVGDSRMLRDRIARALPAWSTGAPDHHAVLGMHAFGLEETGLYAEAEAAGRRAVELEPRNGWARHAVAHVLEMQDRRRDGLAWMRTDPDTWSRESFFAVHNWWHTALFHLGLGEVDEVLALYDGPIYGQASTMAFDLDDAASLLWRLTLMDVDAGERWAALADVYETQPHGRYAFDDAHAMMAFAATGRDAAAEATVAALTASASGQGEAADVAREVGLPVAQAIQAFGRGDYVRSADLLRDVRNRAGRFGGSHAQRDVLDLTLIAAARRGGNTSLERALLAERAAAVPGAAANARELAA
jgi:hypothetical protein